MVSHQLGTRGFLTSLFMVILHRSGLILLFLLIVGIPAAVNYVLYSVPGLFNDYYKLLSSQTRPAAVIHNASLTIASLCIRGSCITLPVEIVEEEGSSGFYIVSISRILAGRLGVEPPVNATMRIGNTVFHVVIDHLHGDTGYTGYTARLYVPTGASWIFNRSMITRISPSNSGITGYSFLIRELEKLSNLTLLLPLTALPLMLAGYRGLWNRLHRSIELLLEQGIDLASIKKALALAAAAYSIMAGLFGVLLGNVIIQLGIWSLHIVTPIPYMVHSPDPTGSTILLLIYSGLSSASIITAYRRGWG